MRKSGVVSTSSVSVTTLDKVIDPPFSFEDKTDYVDLQSCNDKLLAYIDKARVLAQAKQMRSSLPSKL